MNQHGTTAAELPAVNHAALQAKPVPGVVVIFANGRASSRTFRWEGTSLVLGRLELADDDGGDSMISRQHVSLDLDGSVWSVKDLNSRNGTFVGGKPISGSVPAASGTTVRIGGAVLLLVDDTLTFKRHGLGFRDGVVAGPALRKGLDSVALSRSTGIVSSLLISGESGTGKEIAAKVFHDAGGKPNAPFIALNCATIPKDLAERLLFGSRRGAFSGATDAQGYVQAADGGTLFLDEVGELPLDVQSKLLRLLETRDVLRLGATSPERVDVCVCAATWRDLRQEVAAERFREDLYFRIGQPEIRLPPLRERIEEIPWHIQQVLDQCGEPGRLVTTAAFVDACASRHWPGNVRELRAEVKRAASIASVMDFRPVVAEDLSPTAGNRISTRAPASSTVNFPDDDIARALTAETGNVVAAARSLGIHRNKVRRWLERHHVDSRHFKPQRGT